MKISKKKILSTIFILSMFVLTACGLDVDNSIEVNGDFSGRRFMTISADRETLDRVDGGSQSLIDFLDRHISDPLTYSILEESDDSLILDISFNFTSVQDYRQKLDTLQKDNSQAQIQVNYESSNQDEFIEGLSFYDNSSAKIILDYLVDLAIEEELIASGDRARVWDQETYSLIIDNEVLIDDQSLPIEINEMTYKGPSRIYMSTSPRDDGNWDRVFHVMFPSDAEISQTWKESLFGDYPYANLGSSVFTENLFNNTVYKIGFENKTVEELKEITGQVFRLTDNTLNLDIVEDVEEFALTFKLEEEFGHTPFADEQDISSIYYFSPTIPSQHNSQDFSDTSDNYIKMEEEDLIGGFSDTIDLGPSLQSAIVETKLHEDGRLSRSLSISKKDTFIGKKASEIFESYLFSNAVEYKETEDSYLIEYGPDNFSETNGLFFTTDPQVTVVEDGAFNFEYKYVENAILNHIKVDDLEQVLAWPTVSNQNTYTSQISGYLIENNVDIAGYKFNFVLLVLGALLFIALMIYILIRLIKRRKTKKGDGRKTRDFTNQQTSQNRYRDTQPISVVTDDMFISAEDGSIVEGDEFI